MGYAKGTPGEGVLASIVIPAYGRAEALHLTLRGLGEQAGDADAFDVIVVDDGSSPALEPGCEALGLPYRLHVLRLDHRGPAAARNLGARRAEGALLIFLDADMVPASDIVAQYLASAETWPGAIIVGRQLPYGPAFASAFGCRFNYVAEADAGELAMQPPWYYLASGNFAMPRAVFERLGGFDEQLLMTEDTDLAFRAHQSGILIRYQPAAVGYHNHGKTLRELCLNVQASAWWTAQLMKKHPAAYDELPIYREVQPPRPGRDPLRLLLRKGVRRALAARWALRSLEVLVGRLERGGAGPGPLRFWTWKVLNGYRLRGFRAGWRASRAGTPAGASASLAGGGASSD